MGGGREGKGREGRGKGRGKGRGGSSLRARSLAAGIGGRLGWVGLGGVGQAFLNVRALKKIQESFENSL